MPFNIKRHGEKIMSNIISIIEAGNREQFHSSFIAWLLRKDEQHGLNSNFINKFLSLASEDCSSEYEIFTEYKEGRNRYDILLKRKDGAKKIAIENKTKSLGYAYQIENYRDKVDSVILLSLIKENYSETYGAKHITYSNIVSILKEIHFSSKYKVLIDDYCNYLEAITSIFETLNSYCSDKIGYDKLVDNYKKFMKIISENENDKRFLQLFFYHNFSNYLKEKRQELVFGTEWYDKGDATRWISQKNMQGPSFMESLIYKAELNQPKIRLKNDLFELYNNKINFIIAPRFQIWISTDNLIKEESHTIGELLIGTWTKELHNFLQSNLPYKNAFRGKGSRNFHSEPIRVQDLKYERLGKKLKNTLEILYDFEIK